VYFRNLYIFAALDPNSYMRVWRLDERRWGIDPSGKPQLVHLHPPSQPPQISTATHNTILRDKKKHPPSPDKYNWSETVTRCTRLIDGPMEQSSSIRRSKYVRPSRHFLSLIQGSGRHVDSRVRYRTSTFLPKCQRLERRLIHPYPNVAVWPNLDRSRNMLQS
jgi:hypothetical protein